MTTDKILTLINGQADSIRSASIDSLDFLDDESFSNLEEVSYETTNPRRDYVGKKVFVKNKDDNRFFFFEVYGNDNGTELYDVGECTPVEKTITVYLPVTK